MNSWVLITGASQGIGYEFAKIFAARGYNLVLVARDHARLAEVSAELSPRHGITTRIIVSDLARPSAPREIFDELQREQIPISILVNNAGFAIQGPFAQLDLQKAELDLIQVNITSLIELTRRFLEPMLARREGRILNVASTAAYQPGPYMALYYASKSFVLSFTAALAIELNGSGVTATALCPGLTRSQFHSRARLHRPQNFLMMSAEEVAAIGYDALMRRKPVVIAGWLNRLMCAGSKIMPSLLTARIAGKLNEPAAGK